MVAGDDVNDFIGEFPFLGEPCADFRVVGADDLDLSFGGGNLPAAAHMHDVARVILHVLLDPLKS